MKCKATSNAVESEQGNFNETREMKSNVFFSRQKKKMKAMPGRKSHFESLHLEHDKIYFIYIELYNVHAKKSE